MSLKNRCFIEGLAALRHRQREVGRGRKEKNSLKVFESLSFEDLFRKAELFGESRERSERSLSLERMSSTQLGARAMEDVR